MSNEPEKNWTNQDPDPDQETTLNNLKGNPAAETSANLDLIGSVCEEQFKNFKKVLMDDKTK